VTRRLFLVGAGFNADASSEAGPIYDASLYGEQYRIEAGYPLGPETVTSCFTLSSLPDGKSAEDLFAEALLRHDSSPLEKLADGSQAGGESPPRPSIISNRTHRERSRQLGRRLVPWRESRVIARVILAR